MANYTTVTSDKSKGTALGLCCLGFVGIGGIHDFYLGNYGKGIIKLCSLKLCIYRNYIGFNKNSIWWI